MTDNYISDIQKKEIVDYFITSWKEQQFPAKLKISSYEDWRKFRIFWLENEGLDLQNAIDFYLLVSDKNLEKNIL